MSRSTIEVIDCDIEGCSAYFHEQQVTEPIRISSGAMELIEMGGPEATTGYRCQVCLIDICYNHRCQLTMSKEICAMSSADTVVFWSLCYNCANTLTYMIKGGLLIGTLKDSIVFQEKQKGLDSFQRVSKMLLSINLPEVK